MATMKGQRPTVMGKSWRANKHAEQEFSVAAAERPTVPLLSRYLQPDFVVLILTGLSLATFWM
jgi:hypothetical protein